MPNVHSNGIDIAYESIGPRSGESLLLIMGFGRQLIAWPDAFCAALVERGFHVIRFDNRDVGLSSMIRTASDHGVAPYTIDDMAEDAAGLLGALHIDRAHIVGASMGGAIAQSLAIHRPELVASLTSIMSSPGDPASAASDPEVLRLISEPAVDDRQGAIDRAVRIAAAIGSKGMFDEARARDAAERAWDRNPAYDGLVRQRMAMAASGDRTEQLGQLSVPALVIHGQIDPLVSVKAGEATAAAIPGARLLVIPGMGHDLPEQVWNEVADAIAAVAGLARSAVG